MDPRNSGKEAEILYIPDRAPIHQRIHTYEGYTHMKHSFTIRCNELSPVHLLSCFLKLRGTHKNKVDARVYPANAPTE